MATNSDRIFQGESTFPEYEEWFYRAREGIAGPYLRKEDAAAAVSRFVKYCQQNGFNGGREIPDANQEASQARADLLSLLDLAVPVATWMLGVLFGRISSG